MSYLSAAQAIGSLSATGTASGAGLLDACFSENSLQEKPRLPRQVLLGITLAEISRQKMADHRLQLPQRLCGRNSRQALVLDRDDVLFDFLASLCGFNALKTLAQPVFCVQSGMPAHARFDGGEFPTLSPTRTNSDNHPAVEIGFQGYGTDLEVTPRVLPNRTIRLTLSVRQTRPDPRAGTRIGDVILPAISARAVMADAEMPCGKILLLLNRSDSAHTSPQKDLLVLATAKLVRQGSAATHLPQVF